MKTEQKKKTNKKRGNISNEYAILRKTKTNTVCYLLIFFK